MTRWRTFTAAAGLAAALSTAGVAGGPPLAGVSPPAGPASDLLAPIPTIMPAAPKGPIAPPAGGIPAGPTVDQLIDQMLEIRAQKAELEGRERVLLRLINERLQQQKERLAKLAGDGPDAAPQATPAARSGTSPANGP